MEKELENRRQGKRVQKPANRVAEYPTMREETPYTGKSR